MPISATEPPRNKIIQILRDPSDVNFLLGLSQDGTIYRLDLEMERWFFIAKSPYEED